MKRTSGTLLNALISIVFITSVFLLMSCGAGSNAKRAKEIQDSVYKADSMAKIFTEVESWDLLKLAMENEGGLKNKYGNKKLHIKNLVVDNITKAGFVMQCLAYSPKDSLISNTSQKGNTADKVAEIRDYVNDVPCKINSDFTYFFDLTCDEMEDTALLKVKKIKESKLLKESHFYTVVTIEGENISFSENAFTLDNCKIISKN
jgi:hypothetical protein